MLCIRKALDMFTRNKVCQTLCPSNMGGSRGERGDETPILENHKWLKVTNTGTGPIEKQLDLLGPIASRGRLVQLSLKYVDR